MAPTSQVPGPVLPELLIPKAIDHRAHETGNDVDDQEEDVTNLQTEAGEEVDESSLKGRNHKGKHAQQQLEQRDSGQEDSVNGYDDRNVQHFQYLRQMVNYQTFSSSSYLDVRICYFSLSLYYCKHLCFGLSVRQNKKVRKCPHYIFHTGLSHGGHLEFGVDFCVEIPTCSP